MLGQNPGWGIAVVGGKDGQDLTGAEGGIRTGPARASSAQRR